jgi:pyruvate,orthophosphate dikinase
MSTAHPKMVYRFGDGEADGTAKHKELLGGKGANLAEMCQLGVPVPPGFTITTEAFGDPENPLLLSVRSGARASMPGMMDTVLNLGLNDETVRAWRARSGDRALCLSTATAASSRCMPTWSWASTTRSSRKCWEFKEGALGLIPTDVSADEWRELISRYKAIIEEEPVIRSRRTRTSSSGAPSARCLQAGCRRAPSPTASSMTFLLPGARPSMCRPWCSATWATTSATGVAFTRNPSTGAKELYGEFLVNAQGEDVVAGIRTPQSITEKARIEAGMDRPSLEKLMPDAFAEFLAICDRLEKHYRDMQDLEFTIQDGKLWMLQTRSGKRTAKARSRLPWTWPKRADQPELKRCCASTRPRSTSFCTPPSIRMLRATSSPPAFRPRPVLPRARSCSTPKRPKRPRSARPQGHSGAGGNQPGRHSRHACRRRHPDLAWRHDQPRRRCGPRHGQALRLRRRWPAHRRDATAVVTLAPTLKAGDVITIDGSTGRCCKGEVRHAAARTVRRFRPIMEWADDAAHGVRTNAETPPMPAPRAPSAPRASACAAPSTCSSRRPHHRHARDDPAGNAASRRKALAKLLPMQRSDFVELFEIMEGPAGHHPPARSAAARVPAP